MMGPGEWIALGGVVFGAFAAVVGALFASVLNRLAAAERNIEGLGGKCAGLETRLAVVSSQHDGMAATVRRIEAKIDRMMGRESAHKEE